MDPTRRYLDLCCSQCGATYKQQERVHRKSRWKDRCPSCRKTFYACASCERPICRSSVQCKSCAQKLPRPSCADCGKALGDPHVKRCLPCHNKRQNKGKSKKRTIFNVSAAWGAARTSCFERDDYTCQDCGQRGGLLHAHHVKSYRDYADLRLEVSNLLTLCERCHMALHGLTRAA